MSYGAVAVLHDVAMKVGQGEIVAIVGSNGSGKTTLLRCLSGVQQLSSGRVTFMDEDITNMSPDRVVGLGICQAPEGRHIFPTLSVQDNLEMGAYLRRVRRSRGAFADRLAFVFDRFPVLKERRKQKGGTLSGGEQQMLAIGRALMAMPRLLILDEPSMGLAPLMVENIFDAVTELNRSGLTVLLVEQDVEAALSIAKHAYVLQLGRVVLEGSGEELLADESVKAIYLGERKAQG